MTTRTFAVCCESGDERPDGLRSLQPFKFGTAIRRHFTSRHGGDMMMVVDVLLQR